MAVLSQIPKVDDSNQQPNIPMIDIRDTLNHHGSSCTNDLISFFDSRAVINHWSFRKPYSSYLNMFLLSDADIRSINCGFTPLQVASYTTIPDKMDGDMNGWVYTRPSGGQYSPYRVGDYAGYYPSARPMIQDLQVPAEVSTMQTTVVEITAICPIQDGKSVTVADIGGLSSCYGAVYMKHNTQNQTRNIVGTSPLSGGTFNVSIPIEEFINGTWTIYPYITTGSVHYTIPNLSSRTIKITTSNYTPRVIAIRATDGTQTITWSVRVTNSSGEDVTFNNNYIYLRSGGRRWDDGKLDEWEKGDALSDGLVAKANTTTTIATGSFEYIHDKMWTDDQPIVWVTLNSGNYEGSGTPMATID